MISGNIGEVLVTATQHRGRTVDEVVEAALQKILYVSKDAPEPLRAQAEEYKERLRHILRFYMIEAINSDRTTLRAKFRTEIGMPEIAKLIGVL